jgi:hypothetical protein
MPQAPVTVDLDKLTFDEEVELTMAVTGEPEAYAEFMVAIRRGELAGDLEELDGQ